MPGPYTLTLDPDKNGFSYPTGDPANPVAHVNPGETTPQLDACAFIAAINAASAANPGQGGIRGIDMDKVKEECGGGTMPSVTPSPAPGNAPVEGNPAQAGGESADLQGAPRPPVVGTASASPGPPPDPVPPGEEPTRPPLGKPADVAGERPLSRTVTGDPVELFSGALYLEETDLEIPNALVPLAFRRMYRSGTPCFGPLGWNWDHCFNSYLRELSTGAVAVWRELREDIFRNTGGSFEPPRGVFEMLVRLPGPSVAFDILEEGGRYRRYERPPGWLDGERIPLSFIADRHGNRLRFSYGGNDQLVEVRDDDDRYFQFAYDDCGLMTSVTDQAGRRFIYDHDEETMQLVAVTSPPVSDFPAGIRTRYDYESSWAPPELRHAILRVTDGEERVYLENQYEVDPAAWGYGRVVQQLVGGFAYQYCYSALQWVPPDAVFVNIPAARVEVVTPELGLETYTFNYRGDLLDRRVRLSRDGSFRVLVWQYEMDEQGNAATCTRPNGSQEIYQFDFGNADPRMRGRLLRKEWTAAAGFPAPSRIVWRGSYEPTYQLLTSEVNEQGATTHYRYDFDITPGAASNSGKLLEFIQPDATLPGGQVQSASSRYEYNARGQLVAAILPDGTRNELVYGVSGVERAAIVRWIDDAAGLAVTRSVGYDGYGHARSTTDSNGHTSGSKFNALGQLEVLELPPVSGPSASPVTTTYRYDADGFVVATERPAGDYSDPSFSGASIRDEIVRDVLGYPVAHRQAVNTATPRIIRVCSDYRGRPARTINPDRSTLSRKYDERGLLIREELVGHDGKSITRRLSYDRAGNLVRAVDSHGGATTFEYDGFSRLRKVTLPNGTTVRRTFQSGDLVESEEVTGDDGTGTPRTLGRKRYEYDEKGRKIRDVVRSFASDVTAGVDLSTTYHFDKLDRAVQIEGHRGGVWTKRYDALGRLVEQIDPMGHGERWDHDPSGNVIAAENHHREPDGTVSTIRKEYVYDARNRRIREFDPDGGAVGVELDDRDLLVRSTNQLDQVTEKGYDAFGNQVSERIDPGGLDIVRRWDYDAESRLVRFVDPLGQASTYGYDSVGRAETTNYPNGLVVQTIWNTYDQVAREERGSGAAFDYTYDAANRVVRVDDVGTAPALLSLETHHYSYDGLDRVIRAAVGTDTVLRSYDSLGRILEESGPGGSIVCGYDDPNGRTERRWPDGRTETQSYDLNGILSGIDETSPGSLGSGLASIRYVPSGPNFFGVTEFGSVMSVSHHYDQRKRLVGVRCARPQTTLVALQYAYNAANRRSVEETSSALPKLESYRFDRRQRLTTSRDGSPLGFALPFTQIEHDSVVAAAESATSGSAHVEAFTYDACDRRITATKSGVPPRNYTYGSGNRIATDGTQTFQFDADGILRQDGSYEYQADTRGRVRKIFEGGSLITAIEYDALGRPGVISEAGEAAKTLVYFGDHVYQETEGNVPTRQFTRHPLSGMPIANHIGGKTLYCFWDARENLRALIDSDGRIVERYQYDAFGTPSVFDQNGQPKSNASFGLTPIFGGLRYLARCGKYLAAQRILDPQQGLFLTPDPKGYGDSPSLYVYVAQNPVDYTDMLGEQKSPPSTRADRDASANEDDWRWYDNPVWNTATHNGISFAAGLLEEWPKGPNFGSFIKPWANWAAFGKSAFTRSAGGKGWDALIKLDELIRVPLRTRLGGWLFTRPIFSYVPNAARGWWFPMSRINAVLAPLGVVSNSISVVDALLHSDKTIPERVADGTFSALGLFSSGVGTTALLGAGFNSLGLTGTGGLVLRGAGFLGPAGLVTGAAAGGYAIGQFIDEKTGWHESLANRADRNRSIYSDMGLNDTAAEVLGGAAALPILSEVGQGLGWAAFKGYEGYDWTTDKIGYEFCVPFYNCD